MIEKALKIATDAHEGQLRKYIGTDYIEHPISVYNTLKLRCHSAEVLAAALLHDVIEDTDLTYQDIDREFGREIADLVAEVTDVSVLADGNRKVRKLMDLEHLARASPEGKSIKLADILDNAPSIIYHDKKFAKVFMAEKMELLPHLREGDTELFFKVQNLIDDYYG